MIMNEIGKKRVHCIPGIYKAPFTKVPWCIIPVYKKEAYKNSHETNHRSIILPWLIVSNIQLPWLTTIATSLLCSAFFSELPVAISSSLNFWRIGSSKYVNIWTNKRKINSLYLTLVYNFGTIVQHLNGNYRLTVVITKHRNFDIEVLLYNKLWKGVVLLEQCSSEIPGFRVWEPVLSGQLGLCLSDFF